jgi:collagenase-like PrtC family protease
MGNLEFTRNGNKNLNKLLLWLLDIPIDGVVVSNPYLVQYIRKKYQNLEISVSCFANVNSVEKARFWEDLGVTVITLSQVELNRNFKMLQKIRESVECELQLIVNDNCIYDCPVFFYHNNLTSHGSQIQSRLGTFMFDYCFLNCRYRMISEPENFIRAVWIRPEDLSIYEKVGINKFKLIDRGMHTEAIGLIIDAYSQRSYKGNLYDLFNSASKSLWLKKPSFFHKVKYFFHPFTVNIFKMFKHRKIVKDIEVYIDNTKLDGFINFFFNNDCRYVSCKDCGYCRKVAEEAVKINRQYRQKAVEDYKRFINEIVSGGIFTY